MLNTHKHNRWLMITTIHENMRKAEKRNQIKQQALLTTETPRLSIFFQRKLNEKVKTASDKKKAAPNDVHITRKIIEPFFIEIN